MLFASINILLFIWASGFLDILLNKYNNVDNIELPTIDTEYKDLKTPPPELELFPNSKSPIWNSINKDINKEAKEKEKQKVLSASDVEKNEIRQNNIELSNKAEKNKDSFKEKIKEKDLNKNINKTSEKINLEIGEVGIKNKEEIKNNYYVQLASLSENKLVEKEWKRLKKIYNPYLDSLTYVTEKTKINGNSFFRLLVGAFNQEEEAKNFCNIIKLKTICIIKVF